MIRAALALAIGFLIAICLIGFGLSSEEPYDSNYDLESYDDYSYDFDTSSFSSSDDMESSESDEDYP